MMRKLFIILAFFLCAISASAQIGQDAVTAEADGGTGTTITIPLTVTTTTANDTELIVGCGIVDGSSAAIVSSVTWNGSQSLTKVSSQPTGTGFNSPSTNPHNRTETWGLLLPATGSGNVVVTLAAAPTGPYAESSCGATVYVRVNQSLTPDAKNETSNGQGVNPAGTVTTNFTFDWVIDTVINAGGVTNPQATSPSYRQWVNCIFPCTGFLNTSSGSFQIAATAGTVTMLWAGFNNSFSQNIIALKWDGVTAPPATYHISPGTVTPAGNDSNPGTLAAPWLTTNHPVNCGDLILALPSAAYVETNFRINTWGPVTCPSGTNVAWLKCSTFDACYDTITSSSQPDQMTPGSYWGVQGWEFKSTSEPSLCLQATPPVTNGPALHHVIFANNVINGCFDGGIGAGRQGSAGSDYITIIGNAVYNASQGNVNCYSGIDVFPGNSDSLPGTHWYVVGNFAWGTVNPNPCGGGVPLDGEGILFDTTSPFNSQAVIANNISVFNGGDCIQVFLNNTGSPKNANFFIYNNTCYGNETGGANKNPCPEISLNSALSSRVYLNIAQTTAATACNAGGPVTYSALGVSGANATDQLDHNWLYSAAGNNTAGSGAVFVGNLTGTSAAFANPVMPPAPSCSGFASVPACMATMIANFTPTTITAKAYGYQPVQSGSQYDPLFPQWLCGVTNMPAGIITMGCKGIGTSGFGTNTEIQ